MQNENPPVFFERICSNVIDELDKYENYKKNESKDEADKSLSLLRSKQKRIMSQIDSTETHAVENLSEWESLTQWFEGLKIENEQMEIQENDESELVMKMRLAFSSNANRLKSLYEDVIHCLRKLPDTHESPQFIRLKLMKKNMQDYLAKREKILEKANYEVEEAIANYKTVENQNNELIKQNDEIQKQLETFQSSESFQLVQDARKHMLLENEWKEKKVALEENVQNVKNELANYGEKDKSFRKLSIKNRKQIAEEEKLKIKQEELLQELNSEITISSSNIEAVMKQLNIEMQSIRTQQLTRLANETRNIINVQKNKGDRNVAKIKAEISHNARSLTQMLSKLTEPKKNKPIVSPSSTPKTEKKRKILKKKGLKRKKIKKNAAIKEPELVLSLFEQGMNLIIQDQEQYKDFLKTRFDLEIKELNDILTQKTNIIQEQTDHDIDNINNNHKKFKELLEADKQRIFQRILEKDIEISALNMKLVTLEDLVKDYQNHFDTLEKENEVLNKKALELAQNSNFVDLRKEIEKYDQFLNLLNSYICMISENIQDEMNKSQQKASIQEISQTNRDITQSFETGSSANKISKLTSPIPNNSSHNDIDLTKLIKSNHYNERPDSSLVPRSRNSQPTNSFFQNSNNLSKETCIQYEYLNNHENVKVESSQNPNNIKNDYLNTKSEESTSPTAHIFNNNDTNIQHHITNSNTSSSNGKIIMSDISTNNDHPIESNLSNSIASNNDHKIIESSILNSNSSGEINRRISEEQININDKLANVVEHNSDESDNNSIKDDKNELIDSSKEIILDASSLQITQPTSFHIPFDDVNTTIVSSDENTISGNNQTCNNISNINSINYSNDNSTVQNPRKTINFVHSKPASQASNNSTMNMNSEQVNPINFNENSNGNKYFYNEYKLINNINQKPNIIDTRQFTIERKILQSGCSAQFSKGNTMSDKELFDNITINHRPFSLKNREKFHKKRVDCSNMQNYKKPSEKILFSVTPIGAKGYNDQTFLISGNDSNIVMKVDKKRSKSLNNRPNKSHIKNRFTLYDFDNKETDIFNSNRFVDRKNSIGNDYIRVKVTPKSKSRKRKADFP